MLAGSSTRCIYPRLLVHRQDKRHRVLLLKKTLLLRSSKYVTSAYNSDEFALVLSDIERDYYREVLTETWLAACNVRAVKDLP